MLASKIVPGGRMSANMAVAWLLSAAAMLGTLVASWECSIQRMPTSSVVRCPTVS
jgi:hypothetical protein